ncbi:MAG: DEAD/DEAH box helicase [Nitrososphaerales archaeon]
MQSTDLAIIDKFKRVGYNKLTPIQEKALPVLARGVNALLVAPTGSGKTESAVIPIFAMLSSGRSEGIRAIYITPLRALNRDVLRRIIRYAELEGLKVDVRHGDTSESAKRRMTKEPPDVLITTPETLAIILTNEKMLNVMKNLHWVVIDEVHELVSNERGAHLALSLERLQAASTNEIIRIGLSATIGNLDEAAKFVAGIDRRCAVLVDSSVREYDIEVKFVQGSLNDVSRLIADHVKENFPNNSVLLFTNTRDEAEYISTVMKNHANGVKIDVHHGSLSKDMREETESKLRNGTTGIVVCTSSLELGLDIGSVELVIHYGSPRQVSKLIQRIGRSRHKLRQSAKGLLVTNSSDDELEAMAIIRRMKRGSIEQQLMHELSLDVLTHHLVGLALQHKNVTIDQAYKIIARAYPFRQVTTQDIESCLRILDSNRIVNYDRENSTFRRRIKAYKYYFDNISTIPDVLKFEVVDTVSKRIIGSLDQEFVGDYGEQGNVFVLRGSQWRVLAVDDSKLRVSVEPMRGAAVNVPYWVGEMIPVDYETAVEVGRLRRMLAKGSTLVNGKTVQHFYRDLKVIPDHNTIVVESSRQKNAIVIHGCFGTKANNTLCALLSTILSSKLGYMVESRSDAYRIILSSNARITKQHITDCFNDEYDLETVIIASLTNTHNVNWRTWQVAKRFGLIDKKAVYDRKAARLIYERYAKTAISKEAIRELMHDKYDIKTTSYILQRIKKNEIKVIWIDVEGFSDLAKPILEHSTRFSAMPLSVEQGVIELVKERLQKTKHKLICIRCGKWERLMETKDVPEKLYCTLCRSRLITTTYASDYELANIIRTKLNGGKLSQDDEHRFNRAWKAASLIHNFGRKALVVLSGYGVGVDTAARVLRNSIDDSEIYRQIYEAERQYITTRGFWDD